MIRYTVSESHVREDILPCQHCDRQPVVWVNNRQSSQVEISENL